MPGRFDRRFAYQFGGGNWEGWTPPWLHDEPGPGPRFFAKRIKRGLFGHGGPFGQGGPFGPEGPFGPGGETRRFFGRGDLKYALLELLQEHPMHGYEMMKALEEKSGGFYVPSAGSIYPTLQMLEDRGLVTVAEAEGKKVYSITNAGRAFLAEHQKEDDEFPGAGWGRAFGPGGRWNAPEMQALRSEAMEVARLFTIAGRMSFHSPEQFKRLHTIIEHTRSELATMIYGEGKTSDTETPTE